MGSEFCFANNFNWKNVYNIEVARFKDFGIFRNNGRQKNYLIPFGKGDLKEVILELIQESQKQNVPFGMFGISESQKEEIENLFPDYFSFERQREYEDYIYDKEKLATLAGKKLHSKRNHINAFIAENPDWEYIKMTEDNLNLAKEMNEKWCELNDVENDIDKKAEKESVLSAFENFSSLDLSGGMIKAKGEIVAFSIGERLSDDVFVVHIEKAYASVRGAYPMINREFVKNNCEGFKFINREEDTGSEGLRKAKLSYYPELILPKYYAKIK